MNQNAPWISEILQKILNVHTGDKLNGDLLYRVV